MKKISKGDKVVLASATYEHACMGAKGIVTGFINDCAKVDFGYGVVCIRPEDLQLDVLEQLATIYGGPNHGKPDERPKVHLVVLQYSPHENKTDVFGASLDYNTTLKRAEKEAKELGLFDGVLIEGKMVWNGDDGEHMWIASIPLEGNALDLLAAAT